jgi:hypothetical protein
VGVKILYTNGCSFSQGDQHPYLPEQEDLTYSEPPYDDNPWPNVIAEKFDLHLVNESKTGTSNFRIVRNTLDWFRNFKYDIDRIENLLIREAKIRERTNPPIINPIKYNKFKFLLDGEKIDMSQVFVIIGWTSLDRWEYFDSDKIYWKNVTPNSEDSQSKKYYKYYHDEDAARLDYENQITLLGSFLKNIGVRFLFFNSLPIYSFSYTKPISVLPWYGYDKNLFIDEKNIFSPFRMELHTKCGENFLEYLESIEDSQSIYKKRKLDSVWLSEDSHPSDKGHKLWANKLIKHIEKYGLME